MKIIWSKVFTLFYFLLIDRFAFILLFLPAVQLLMTFYVVGKEPTDLKLGVINNEVMSFTSHAVDDYCQNVTFTKGHPVHCDLTFLSCHIQNDLLRNEKINLVKRDINNVVRNSL